MALTMLLEYRSIDLITDDDPRLAAVFFDLQGYDTPPQVKGTDYSAPRQAGRYQGNFLNDAAELTLNGFIRGMGTSRSSRSTDWRTTTDAVMAAFQMDDDPGLLRVGNGYLGISGVRQILARTVSVMPGRIRNHMSHQVWSIGLRTVTDPEWEDGS